MAGTLCRQVLEAARFTVSGSLPGFDVHTSKVEHQMITRFRVLGVMVAFKGGRLEGIQGLGYRTILHLDSLYDYGVGYVLQIDLKMLLGSILASPFGAPKP